MKIGICAKDFDFALGGHLIRKFEKGHSYMMSEVLMRDIVMHAGNSLFGSIRDFDGSHYKKYKGENLDNKSIFIWRTGGMGDLCFITPYMKKIKELYPTCKIYFGCGTQYSDVMSKHPCVDVFHTLPLDIELLKTTDFHIMFEGIIEDTSKRDAIEKNAYDLFGEYFGIELSDEEKIPYLNIEQENLDYFKKHEKDFIKISNPIKVGIHLKTSSIIRDVHPDVLKKIVNELMFSHPNICIYLFGYYEDAEIGNQITVTKDAIGRFFPFYQITRGFRDSVAGISEMDLMIGGDSSGLHIGAAFKKPLIGLYGAFTPYIRMAYYQNASGFHSGIKCSPCFLHGNEPCDYSDFDGYSLCMKIYSNPKEISRIVDEAFLLLSLKKKIDINSLSPQNSLKLLAIYKETFTEEKKL